MRLKCSSGEVDVKIGDTFMDGGVEWEIVDYPGTVSYSPSTLGGTPTVTCKPLSPPAAWWKQYMDKYGNVDWCGDSIAASMLSIADMRPRSARGDFLTK